MSIQWMTRVWAAPEPAHPTDRLMLLALADNANDEGYCWPCVATLQRRCRLGTLRGTRKVLERLEGGAFVERISRPGRSNLYRLREEPLGGDTSGGDTSRGEPPSTPERQDRGSREQTPERADRGGRSETPEPQDRGGGTSGPGTPEPADRVPRSARTAITNKEPSVEPSLNNSAVADDADANATLDGTDEGVVVVGLESDLIRLLVERGVHAPVAERLVRQYGAGRAREQVEHFDRLCAQGKKPRGAGWLVKAIEEGYPPPERAEGHTAEAGELYSYREMLAWCERQGGLALTKEFEPVKEKGKTLFRLRRGN